MCCKVFSSFNNLLHLALAHFFTDYFHHTLADGLHQRLLLNVQQRSLFLSEPAKAFVQFHLPPPKDIASTPCNPAITLPLQSEMFPPKRALCHHFFFFFFCTHKSQLWGGSRHNNEPRCYLCFNWLCCRNSLDRRQRSSSHTHVISLLYFGNSTEQVLSSLLEVLFFLRRVGAT